MWISKAWDVLGNSDRLRDTPYLASAYTFLLVPVFWRCDEPTMPPMLEKRCIV
jgi:hypothetical protein